MTSLLDQLEFEFLFSTPIDNTAKMHKAFGKLHELHDKFSDNATHHADNNATQYPTHGHPSGHFDLGAATSRKAVYPQPGQHPPGPGQMPPKVAKLEYTPKHVFYHPNGKPHEVMRDNGHSCILDGRIIWSWGDTLMGTTEKAFICSTDSTSIGSLDRPMESMDTALWPNSDNVADFIPCTAEEEAHGGLAEHAYGATTIIETEPNKGIVFFLHNHRPGGKDHVVGTGVATVHMGPDHIPRAQRGPTPHM